MSNRAFRAPGRVNLIGEHTDYNLGFVLPIAIDLACIAEVSASTDNRLHVYSENKKESKDWDIASLREPARAGNWTDYIAGVARELIRAGFQIEPQKIRLDSTVPDGSGLSSSASLEVSTALALLADQKIDPVKLALLCQRAEVEFVGTPCGIMDQYVSIFGQKDAAIRIDCRDLTHEVVTLPHDVEVVAVNSMVKHELAQSAYRKRTEECAEAVEALRAHDPKIQSLRDVSPSQLAGWISSLPAVPAKRAHHVVNENDRVEKFVAASERGDLAEMGKLFVESHRSLQHDYEVSSEELDFLVDTAIAIEGVYGARMTGGGFGGSIVNLLAPGTLPKFRSKIEGDYERRFGRRPEIFVCRPSAGASELKVR